MPYKYKASFAAWQRAWLKRHWAALVLQFGGMCAGCEATERLEFAHLRPTKLNGESRGKRARYFDIHNNPSAYWLLCHSCHVLFDRRRKR